MIGRLLLLLWFLPFPGWAQENIPIGTWRTHFSFRDAQFLAVGDNKVYCSGQNSLFFLDLSDNSLTRLSKIDGLSGSKFASIGFHANSSTLIITYLDGTIDLLQDNTIESISALADAPLTGSKEVNHITSQGDFAYLSGDFGVAVLDVVKAEIMEAYTNIGASGEVIAVHYGTVFQDSLFLATEQGLIAGWLDPSINLLDFTNWKRFEMTDGIPAQSISAVANFDNRVWASIDLDGFYTYQGSDWQRVNFDLDAPVKAITSLGNELLITLPQNLLSADASEQFSILSDPLYALPQFSLRTELGLWVADSVNGLVTNFGGGFEDLYPPGPFSDSIQSVHFVDNKITVLPPSFNNLRRPLNTMLGINQFQEGLWNAFNSSGLLNTNPFPATQDLMDITLGQDGNYYFASFSEGILQWSPEGGSQIFDDNTPGSTLRSNTPFEEVLVSAVEALGDAIWAVNYGSTQPLHEFDPGTGNWRSFATSFLAARFPLDMQVAENGDFWLRLDPLNGGGIWVINPESGQQKYLSNIEGQGGLPSRNVQDLAIDEDGQVWVGTDDGVALYPFPFDLLERNEVNASRVFIDGRPLLRDERVTSIAVDGGNRKWIGTENGLWLFSALGDSVIFNFTMDNSPLPDNNIIDLAIDQNTGEIFVVTETGVVSFRGTSTQGAPRHQQVAIFPNPVTRDFNGLVGISGLVNNAVVKIADVTGKLVNELRAQGGTAVWNIADYQGRRVASGVYLVYSSSNDGEETFIGKIAVIN